MFLGALISAGFEVSATVIHDKQQDLTEQAKAIVDVSTNSSERVMKHHSTMDTMNKKSADNLLDSMVDWLIKVPENEL